jgi:hypothetical protein
MMSDPAGKGEIEDVIASIRKLVRSAPNAHRLVLTEALRVDAASPDDTDARSADGEGADGADDRADPHEALDRGAAGTAVSLEKALAELEAELAVDAAMGSREDRYDPWEPVDASPREAAAAEPGEIEIELEVASATEAEVVMFSRVGASARSSGAEAGDAGQASAEEDAVPAEAVAAVDAAPADPAPEPVGSDAPEAAFARVEEAAARPEPVYRPVEPDPQPQGPAENVASPDAESLLDENELRALVAEVLREELKGPLGERITRNVRKLVRREIAQALSNYDLG